MRIKAFNNRKNFPAQKWTDKLLELKNEKTITVLRKETIKRK